VRLQEEEVVEEEVDEAVDHLEAVAEAEGTSSYTN
jgi:hypothetical protein